MYASGLKPCIRAESVRGSVSNIVVSGPLKLPKISTAPYTRRLPLNCGHPYSQSRRLACHRRRHAPTIPASHGSAGRPRLPLAYTEGLASTRPSSRSFASLTTIPRTPCGCPRTSRPHAREHPWRSTWTVGYHATGRASFPSPGSLRLPRNRIGRPQSRRWQFSAPIARGGVGTVARVSAVRKPRVCGAVAVRSTENSLAADFNKTEPNSPNPWLHSPTSYTPTPQVLRLPRRSISPRRRSDPGWSGASSSYSASTDYSPR